MPTQELISVVLCTYNGMKFIAEQLKSIQEQTYRNLEIVIVDDASTDATFMWLLSEAKKDTRILLHRNKNNIGYNANFSRACSYANGRFIAIADQDDIWKVTKLEILLDEIIKDDNIMLVYGISVKVKERKFNLKKSKLINYFSGNDARQFFLNNSISGHNMLFRQSLLKIASPFPENGYYDWWLVINACSVGMVKAVNQVLVYHRVHDSNATLKAKTPILLYKLTQNNLKNFLKVDGLTESAKRFGHELLALYNQFPEKSFSFRLFRFLFANAHILFGYKKRTFPFVANLIRAVKLANASKRA